MIKLTIEAPTIEELHSKIASLLPKQEAPKQEEPKTKQEAPKQEEPKTKQEDPKQETPKKETPKKETPKKETPKKETPKKETPKKEDPKPKQEAPKQEEANEKQYYERVLRPLFMKAAVFDEDGRMFVRKIIIDAGVKSGDELSGKALVDAVEKMEEYIALNIEA